MLLASLVISCTVVIALPIIIWWMLFTLSPTYRQLNRLPGPTSLPVIGNIHQLLGGFDVNLELMQRKWTELYGEIYRIIITPTVGILISSPEMVETVVNSPQLMDKGIEYKLMHDWLGLGLLTSSGAKWKSRRRLLTPAFHFNIMEDFFDTFNEQSSILCDKIGKMCEAKGAVEVNVEELTSLCTLDIICETAMGCKVNAQHHESEYVRAVQSMSKLLMKRQISLLSRIDFIYQLTPTGKEYYKTLKTLLDFTEQVIEKRQREFQSEHESDVAIDDGTRKRRPFLDLLLEASAKGTVLSRKDLSDEVNTFMFEGHDTTAMTLNWFLYCMAAHPEHQDRLREELDQVFEGSDRPCTRQDLPELKYLECCIKETLRLYPAVPAFSREVKQQVQLGKYTIPGGCDLVIAAYGLHRNPRIFPDPDTFDPDRFTPERSSGRHPYAFIPFSAGSRNCIGQRFAMAEEKVVLASLFRRFKFRLSPTAPLPIPSVELTLKSSTGIHLVVSRR
nr:CYP4AP3 protein [Diaphanosoma celebensis]